MRFLKYKYWSMGESMLVFGVFIVLWINIVVYFVPANIGFIYLFNTSCVGIAAHIYTLLKMGTEKEIKNEREHQ